jgi:hypothetical protein
MRIRKTKFPECKTCIRFSPEKLSPQCVRCDAGQFFEEKLDDSAPDQNTLMKIFGKMYPDE